MSSKGFVHQGVARYTFKAQPSTSTTLSVSLSSDSSLQLSESVLVVGGTGGVGQLVATKLSQTEKYNVRVTSRNVERAEALLEDPNIEVVKLDLVGQEETDFRKSQNLMAALEDVSAVVISVGTTAFPTEKWKNNNTPHKIDYEAVKMIVKAAGEVGSVKRVVLLTSIGVERRKSFPFVILNLFGVLDAKRNGEAALIAAASEGQYDYAIIRPGRLVGGPYTNLDLANLLKIEGGAENGVTVESGDTLVGDCKRDACAEAVIQCLENQACRNLVFSIVSNEEPALRKDQWTNEFNRLSLQ